MTLILQLTDSHFCSRATDTMLGINTRQSFIDTLDSALARGRKPDLVLFTGDLSQDGSQESYHLLRESLKSLTCDVYCLPGNHDAANLMVDHLTCESIHVQTRILLDHWQILCLNSTIPGSDGGRIDEPEIEKLVNMLEMEPDRYTLIAMHHHPVPTGSHWMDKMQVQNTNALFSALKPFSRVQCIIFGHVHQELDTSIQEIRILGTPSTCFQFKPGQTEFTIDEIPAGYRWIELGQDGSIDTLVERSTHIPSGLERKSAGY